jgi:hypothetical protein
MAQGTPNFSDLGTDVVDVLQADGWAQSGVAAAGFWRVTQLNKAKKAVDIYTPAGTKQDRVWLTPAKGGKSAESSALQVLEAAGIAPAQRTQKGVRLVRVTRRDRAKKNGPGARQLPAPLTPQDVHRAYDRPRRNAPGYPTYPFYTVEKATGGILGGWDYREDAKDQLDELVDVGWPKRELTILTAKSYAQRHGTPSWRSARRNVVGYEDEEIVIGPIPFSSRARQNPIHGARRNPGATLASSSTRRPPALNPPRRVTFGPVYQGSYDDDKSWDILLDGERAGEVVGQMEEVGLSTREFRITNYEVRFYDLPESLDADFRAPLGQGRKALTNAKNYARKTLLAHSTAENPPLLPLTSSRRKWDATKARRALKKWATTNSGTVDMKKYARGFLAHDGNPQNLTSYKLPIATVIKDKAGRSRLKAVPHAIYAAAGVIDGARGGVELPAGQRTKAKAQLARYYKKMKKTPPWRK